MVAAAGRRKSIAFFISLGAGLIVVVILLYIGWVLLDWHTGILLFFSVILVALIISGVALKTIFLVRAIRLNEQHDAFINAVTHELKTPVASIRLYLETLMTRTVDEEKRHEFYQTMLEDSDRLLSTVEQILRTGRVGPSRRLLSLSAIDLDEVIEECLDRARKLHDLAPEALTYTHAARVRVEGDVDEIRAAVFNLIDNAAKYSGPSVRVIIETKMQGDSIAVRVRDQGVGIAKPELKRIFRRFYRIPGSGSMRPAGTGLGLYIVRSVAKRHGGRAWAESAGVGHGSTFVLQLPIAR